MANPLKRSRSNTSVSTKSNTRPLSRASTTSLQSFDQHLQPANGQHPTLYEQHQQYNSTYPPLEPALIQAAQHASQQENIPLGQSMQMSAFSTSESMQPQPAPNGLPDMSHSFDHNHAAQALQAALGQPHLLQPGPVEVEEKKKKSSSSSSATNDKELREMLVRNDGRELKDVAAEVIATDRTSKAEKSKQLFAMLWLKSVCRVAKTSVPRNRVYSKYAIRCGTERVIPLNPASFGKLVRVIFPGIQTRRLGVRGESKYHYVDLALLDDSQDNSETERAMSRPPTRLARQSSVSTRIDFNTMPRLTADTAVFPPQDQTYDSPISASSQDPSRGRLFTNIYSNGFSTSAPTSTMYEYDLKFPPADPPSAQDNVEVALPDITNYLPPKTDPDAADALKALYRTHCTSLIDSVRYCREKQFFRLFASFHGTLTVPVQKLFAQPEIAPWIRECDWMMYQKMIGNVSQLTLQVAPAQVLRFLDNVSKTLHSHISKVFIQLPLHTREAKLEPATLFGHLLRQMLRVNSTAHAAAVFLAQDGIRDQMWADWKGYVNIKRIIENELPNCGHEEAHRILANDIRSMLLPLHTQIWLPDGNYYQEAMTDTEKETSNETVIDRIATFLNSLSTRFPHASARTIIQCVSCIGSAIIREITVEQGQSFNAWWVTKVFVDEMCHWLAALGGFLDHKPPTFGALAFSPSLMDGPLDSGMTNGGSNQESRYSSMDADFGGNQSFMTTDMSMQDEGTSNNEVVPQKFHGQYDQVNFDHLVLGLGTSQNEQNLDDSAIALMDDSLEAKYSNAVHTLNAHPHLNPVNTGVR